MSYAVRLYYNKCCHCEARSAAAIPWSKVRGKYCVLFRGDRHANARDDTEIQLSLQGSIATAAISREGGFLQSTYSVLTRWDISLTLNMTYFLLPPSGEARFVLLSLRRSVATAAISREGGFLQSTYSVLTRWDISLTLNMTYFLLPPSGEARFVLLSLRRSVATAAISREGVGLRSMFC